MRHQRKNDFDKKAALLTPSIVILPTPHVTPSGEHAFFKNDELLQRGICNKATNVFCPTTTY
jgi:hypothetical protein